MSGSRIQPKANGAADRAVTGGPIPGGRVTLPARGDPLVALGRVVLGMQDIPQNLKQRYIELIAERVREQTGGVIQAGQSIDLPTLAELHEYAGAGNAQKTTRSPPPADRCDEPRNRAPDTAVDPPQRGVGCAVPEPKAGGVELRNAPPAPNRAGRTSAGKTRAPLMTVEPTRKEPVNVRAETRSLASAVRRGDMNAVFTILHGKAKEDQQAIIREFDRLAIAQDTEAPVVNSSVASGATGLLASWVQRKVGLTETQHNDFMSRVGRMDDRTRVRITAYLENSSSQLEPADKLYLSMRGSGTYEEGIYRSLRNMTRAEIEQQAILYAQRYHSLQDPSVSKAMELLEHDLESELSGSDEVKALLYLRGKDHITKADLEALELYTHGAGMSGTNEIPIFRLLEGESAAGIRAIAEAYQNLPNVDGTLFGDLDGEFDGVWFHRMNAAYAGNDAPEQTRAKYVARSAQLFLSGGIEWEEMSRIFSRYIDPSGESGITLAQADQEFRALGFRRGLTETIKMFHGSEVDAMMDILQANQSVTNSPRALAVRLYHQTLGQSGTDEAGVCRLLAATTAPQRAEIDREFRALSRQLDGKEQSVADAIRSDFSDSPRWMERALEHWQYGALPAEAILHHVSRGAGKDAEAIRALSRVPAGQRSQVKQRMVERYFSPDPPNTTGPARTDLTAEQPLGADARWDNLIEKMEAGFRSWQAQGHGLNSVEGRDSMMRLASTFAVQMGVDILRTRGDEGVEALAARPRLEAEILAKLQAANQRDSRDGRIRQDNLQRIAAHIAGVMRGQWPEYDRAVGKLGDRASRSMQDLMAAGNLRHEGLEGLKARVGQQIERERRAGGWNAVSSALMDRFGWTGESTDEAARDFFLEVERASADGSITKTELQGILNRYSEFLELVKEYQADKDQVGEVAGDIAAAAAATIVTLASGGSAAPLIVTLAAGTAGAAKVGTEKAFRGQDYQMGSVEFWKDLAVGGIDGAVTVYTAGMAKTATGARFMRGVIFDAHAAGTGSGAAMASRTVLDEATWEEGFLEGLGNVGRSGAMGYGMGFGMGGGMSVMIRGAGGGLQRLRMRSAERRAAAQTGSGTVASDVVTDTHGHVVDVGAQLHLRTGSQLRHAGDIIDKAAGASLQGGGTRNVIRKLRSVEPPGGRIQISYGNHEHTLGAVLDDVTFYGSREGRAMFRASIQQALDATGDTAMSKAVRQEAGRRLQGMLQRHGSRLSREGREQLEGLSRALSRGDTQALRGATRTLEQLDDDVGRMLRLDAELNRDVALRRLLGKPSTNFAQSVLEGYGIIGDVAMGQQMRREMAGRLRTALQQHGDRLNDRARAGLQRFVGRLEDTGKKVSDLKLLEEVDSALGDVVEAGGLTRRDVLGFHMAASSMTDREIAAKRIFLAFSDNGGDMARATAAVRELASQYDLDPAVLASHLQGMQAMSDDFNWMFERMVAFQIDPANGALITHAGWPYSVVDGKTVLRPDRLLEAQRMVAQRRYLGLFQPEQLNLDPAWAGESLAVNARTGGGTKIRELTEFSFNRRDVTASSYRRAMQQLNDELSVDHAVLRDIGLSRETFRQARFMATGHEQLKPDPGTWITQRARHLMRQDVPKEQAWRQAGAEFATHAKLNAVGDELDRLRGWHARMDWGLEDGRFGGRQPGGRFEFMEDGSFRIRKVTSMQEGRVVGFQPSPDAARAMANDTVTLQRAGAIELPQHVRAREIGRFQGMLRRAGISDEEVASVLRRQFPGKSTEEAMEQFVVDFYRVAGRNEAAVLDRIAGAFGREPSRAAIEFGSPLQAFRALARNPEMRPATPMENIFSGAGRLDMGRQVSRAQLVETVEQMVRANPGSRIVTRGVNDIVVEMTVNGVRSTVSFSTDMTSPWIAFAVVPGTVATASDGSQRSR